MGVAKRSLATSKKRGGMKLSFEELAKEMDSILGKDVPKPADKKKEADYGMQPKVQPKTADAKKEAKPSKPGFLKRLFKKRDEPKLKVPAFDKSPKTLKEKPKVMPKEI